MKHEDFEEHYEIWMTQGQGNCWVASFASKLDAGDFFAEKVKGNDGSYWMNTVIR